MAITIDQLLKMGFSDEIQEVPRRAVVSLSGKEKTGKTRWALTAPDPIVFFNIDIGTEGVIEKFQTGKGVPKKQILIYNVSVPKEATQNVYENTWNDFKAKAKTSYGLKGGTVIFDTGTEAYELNRLARFGKLTQVMPHHYAEVNNEWRDLIRTAYDSDMNTVLVHKLKPRYVNNTRTSEYDVAGFGETAYLVQANVRTFREDNEDQKMPTFGVTIQDCRQNPKINGETLSGPISTFEFLLGMIHG